MELYESIRARQDDVISQNSSTITISRTTRAAAEDGGYNETTATLAAQTMRLYTNFRKQPVVIVDEAGYSHDRAVKLVARYNANINKKTATNTDRFTIGTAVYEVIDVKDITTQGQIVFKECWVELVN